MSKEQTQVPFQQRFIVYHKVVLLCVMYVCWRRRLRGGDYWKLHHNLEEISFKTVLSPFVLILRSLSNLVITDLVSLATWCQEKYDNDYGYSDHWNKMHPSSNKLIYLYKQFCLACVNLPRASQNCNLVLNSGTATGLCHPLRPPQWQTKLPLHTQGEGVLELPSPGSKIQLCHSWPSDLWQGAYQPCATVFLINEASRIPLMLVSIRNHKLKLSRTKLGTQ